MGIEEFVSGFNAARPTGAMMEFVPWEEETVWDHVGDAHMVLIPSDLSIQGKAVKSANRLVDALHCGRFVIASPVPAYETFADCVWLGDDPMAGIEWAAAHADQALEKIRQGQERVMQRHSEEAIARQWAGTFAKFTSGSQAAALPIDEDKVREATCAPVLTGVRLNLGCGDKILEGYVNVDVAPSRAGKVPDVLCDLRNLSSFASDSADEILSVHVIEHFWRWEVEGLLREWVRVLKPGGRLILECPNLISACQALLANPDQAGQADARGRMSMWVFYGDPAWRDPLMCHRWGYSPSSLSALLEGIGLVNVRQGPAQFKMREPRDMRIVGEKPEHLQRAVERPERA
jgi:SAM-dependent methyltransferase